MPQATRSTVPNRLASAGIPQGLPSARRRFSKSSAGPPACSTRRWISVTSRSGETGAAMRLSRPAASSRAMKSRRDRSVTECAPPVVDRCAPSSYHAVSLRPHAQVAEFGRRAGFRYLWPQGRGSSSLLLGTNLYPGSLSFRHELSSSSMTGRTLSARQRLPLRRRRAAYCFGAAPCPEPCLRPPFTSPEPNSRLTMTLSRTRAAVPAVLPSTSMASAHSPCISSSSVAA